MAEGGPLEVDVARFQIDNATGGELKKIDDDLEAVNETLDDTADTVEATGKSISRFKKIASSAFKSARVGATAFKKSLTGLRKGAGAGLSGAGRVGAGAAKGGLGGALGNIPIIGALFAASFAAVNSVRDQFVSSLSLRKELLSLSTDFQASFRTQAKSTISAFKKGGIFRKEDIEATLAGLTNLGISPEAIQNNTKLLKQFTTSQGFTSLSEGLGALASGQVKAGRGIGTGDILQIQQISSLLSNVATADQGFKLLIQVLDKNKDSISDFSDITVNSLQTVVKQQNKQIQFEQERAKRAAEAGEKLVEGTDNFTLASDALKRQLAGGAEVIVTKAQEAILAAQSGNLLSALIPKNAATDFILNPIDSIKKAIPKNKFTEFLFGKADGGPVGGGKSFLVGERGPELFTPSGNGNITSNERLKAASTTNNRSNKMQMVQHNTFHTTIHTQNPNVGPLFEKSVKKAMDNIAGSFLSDEAGLMPDQR